MASIADLFDQAQRYHQSGDLAQAEPLYRELIQADPGHADALHLLGILAQQCGRLQEAAALIQQAIALKPAAADFHNNLGVLYKELGKLSESIPCYRRALAINSQHVPALDNLGVALKAQGQMAEAEECHRRALRIDPNYADAHYNLGRALQDQEQLAEAGTFYRQALRLNPNHVGALNNLGVALKDQGQLAEAGACFRQALAINPNQAVTLNNLGIALAGQKQLDQAVLCYRRALHINPDDAHTHNNLALALLEQRQMGQAIDCFRQAVRINPGLADVHINLGTALNQLGQLDEASASFRQALAIDPKHLGALNNLALVLLSQARLAAAAECYRQALVVDPDHKLTRANAALLRLLQGDFEGAWTDFELRWALPAMTARSWRQPRWDGSPLDGKTILVYAEQGFGDTIQFARYLPMVKERGGKVVFECQPPLLSLFTDSGDVDRQMGTGRFCWDRLIAAGQPLPPFDVQIPLLSLPGLFGTTLETIPAHVPYMAADPKKIAQWRQFLLSPLTPGPAPLIIGINWQGNPKVQGDRLRSIPLTHFEPLARLPGVKLVSLQKGAGIDQLRSLADRFPILDLSERLQTFSDTAAVMMNMDLVITSDTSVAHLAGALGVPVWTALQIGPDWRWLLDRSDSPWYPTMRLFRQQRQGDWDDVFKRIAEEVLSLF